MSQLLARIMLAIFMLPCAGLMYLAVYGIVSLQSRRGWLQFIVSSPSDRRFITYACAGITMFVFATAYWWFLWRPVARWNSLRSARAIVVLLLIVCITPLAHWSTAFLTDSKEFGALLSSLVPTPLWMIALTLILCESKSERAARASGQSALTCPTCGYNLTGLQSTRCPECGTQFTLEELISRQKSASEPDLT